MLWVKEGPKLRAEMPQHFQRVADTIRLHWRTATIWKRENGHYRGVLHDLLNVVVEATKIDPYFAAHWFVVALAANSAWFIWLMWVIL